MKEWRSPRLVELVRGRPEEAILVACKAGIPNGPSISRTSPINDHASCVAYGESGPGLSNECTQCASLPSS